MAKEKETVHDLKQRREREQKATAIRAEVKDRIKDPAFSVLKSLTNPVLTGGPKSR